MPSMHKVMRQLEEMHKRNARATQGDFGYGNKHASKGDGGRAILDDRDSTGGRHCDKATD
jgi:hypothetical protein